MGYSERYVAFVDILGFSEIVRQTGSDQTPKRYDALVKTLSEIGTREGTADEIIGVDFQFQSFSDSVVLSSLVFPIGLIYLLSSISELAIRLLRNGLLMRGAVAKGKLHHHDGVMFGPAFLEAYRIENMVAKYPRIILSKETYEDRKAVRSGVQKEPSVLLDEDGPPYLHVFAHLEFQLANNERRDLALQDAMTCQRAIQNLLNTSIHDPNHYEKLRWLAIYWNGTIASNHPELEKVVFPFQSA
jgi:hypothetical protein